jgi:hypothetical protein
VPTIYQPRRLNNVAITTHQVRDYLEIKQQTPEVQQALDRHLPTIYMTLQG